MDKGKRLNGPGNVRCNNRRALLVTMGDGKVPRPDEALAEACALLERCLRAGVVRHGFWCGKDSNPDDPMPYELTLRLKSATPVCGQLLLSKLLLAGLRVRPEAVPPGLFGDGLARFEVITDPAAPAGVGVSVKIPNGRTFVDVTIELLHLERLAGFIEADVMDGDEVMVHSGQKGLAALFAFHARYEQASHGAPPALEVA